MPAALNSAGLKLALKLLDNGDPAAATVAAYALPDPVDIKIVDWLVATSGSNAVPSSRILAVRKKLSDWPGQTLLRLRYEQAIARENLAPADIIKALGASKPVSDSATIELAEAYVASGRQKDAATLIRSFWRNEDFSRSDEKTILSEFGDLLTAADHKARMDRLLYDGQSDDALRVAALIGKDQLALAKAVVSTIKQRKTAYRELTALPGSVRNDPLALYSRIQALRRADKIDEAAKLLLSAPRRRQQAGRPQCLVDRAPSDLPRPDRGAQAQARLPHRGGPFRRVGHLPRRGRVPRRLVRARVPARSQDRGQAFCRDRGHLDHAAQPVARRILDGPRRRRRRRQGRSRRPLQARRRLSDDLLRPVGACPAGQYPAAAVAAPHPRCRRRASASPIASWSRSSST